MANRDSEVAETSAIFVVSEVNLPFVVKSKSGPRLSSADSVDLEVNLPFVVNRNFVPNLDLEVLEK